LMEEKNKYDIFWVCVCSLNYLVCKAHAQNFTVICGLSVCILCFVLSHIGTTGKTLLNTKCVFWFSLPFLSETFIARRRIQWDMTNLHGFSCKVPVTLVIFKLNLSFLYRYSKKFPDIKFHENPSSGSRVVPCGQTDEQRRDEVNSRFSQFCERS